MHRTPTSLTTTTDLSTFAGLPAISESSFTLHTSSSNLFVESRVYQRSASSVQCRCWLQLAPILGKQQLVFQKDMQLPSLSLSMSQNRFNAQFPVESSFTVAPSCTKSISLSANYRIFYLDQNVRYIAAGMPVDRSYIFCLISAQVSWFYRLLGFVRGGEEWAKLQSEMMWVISLGKKSVGMLFGNGSHAGNRGYIYMSAFFSTRLGYCFYLMKFSADYLNYLTIFIDQIYGQRLCYILYVLICSNGYFFIIFSFSTSGFFVVCQAYCLLPIFYLSTVFYSFFLGQIFILSAYFTTYFLSLLLPKGKGDYFFASFEKQLQESSSGL